MSERLEVRRFSVAETALSEITDFLRPPLLRRYATEAERVRRIVDDVASRGDEALLEYVRRFDWPGATLDALEIPREEITSAADRVTEAEVQAVRRACAAVREFHERSVPHSWLVHGADRSLGQRVAPLRRVAMYVPGGTPLPSSVYMCAVPAKVAGVPELIMVSPSASDGSLHPLSLVAAAESGVDRVFRIGSAWAVAALAYGTATIPRVDKIVGPGVIYAMLAMREVFGQVGIDSLPGPSDVLVISDGSASAEWVAADLLSQAEHGANASAVLCTPSASHLEAVCAELARQVDLLPRASAARATLRERGALILCRDLEECAAVADAIGPEHLELLVESGAESLAERVANAGAIFLGPWTPEPVGDYVAGPSHVLPTEGTARFLSPLGVESFLKRTSLVGYSQDALLRDAEDTIALAEAEGLTAHARAVSVRVRQARTNQGERPPSRQ